MNYLEINHIKKSFGEVEVLKDISLKVKQGQVTSIIGPSGSGKTTLLRCATMLETMDDGEMFYLGEQVVKSENNKAVYAPNDVIKKFVSITDLYFRALICFRITVF